jgi:hypothetical protein
VKFGYFFLAGEFYLSSTSSLFFYFFTNLFGKLFDTMKSLSFAISCEQFPLMGERASSVSRPAFLLNVFLAVKLDNSGQAVH